MSAKPTGLAAFTKNKAPEVPELAATAGKATRKRAQGDTVALTVRIPRSDWMRLHQLAMTEGVSLQNMAVEGFSQILAKHGLPPIAS